MEDGQVPCETFCMVGWRRGGLEVRERLRMEVLRVQILEVVVFIYSALSRVHSLSRRR